MMAICQGERYITTNRPIFLIAPLYEDMSSLRAISHEREHSEHPPDPKATMSITKYATRARSV